MLKKYTILSATLLLMFSCARSQKITAIKCGKLLDVKLGTVANNQVIIIKDNIIQKIEPNASFQEKADSIIDLSDYFVLYCKL